MLCGAGRRVINPEIGHKLAGYGPDYPNQGVHDDIVVTALFLQQGERQALVLSFDLIGLSGALNLSIRQAVSKATGVPLEHVHLTTTHVHSGPEVRTFFYETGPAQRCRADYNERLIQWACQGAVDAKASAQECDVFYNFTFEAVNMNRRYCFPDRRWLYIPNNKQLAGQSYEFVDRELGVIGFRKKGTRNQYQAVLTNYPAHPLCVGNSANLVSADYQGALRRTVEETFTGSLCVTTTGPAGDMHPLMPESGFASAMTMGQTLGRSAICRLYDAVKLQVDEELRIAYEPLALPVKDQATADLLPDVAMRTLPDAAIKGAKEIATHVSLLGIGPVLLVGVPGELLAEPAAMIKWSSPFLRTYILFQATDSVGYIPSRNQYMWGGYEPSSSPLAAGAAEKLVGAVLESAHRLLAAQPLKLE